MPLEMRGAHFLIRSAQLVRGTRLEYALVFYYFLTSSTFVSDGSINRQKNLIVTKF